MASSPSNSLCEGSISPSSVHSHSQPSTREPDSSQHSLRNDASSDDPTDFSSIHGHESLANLPANIEIHPQNDALSSTSSSHQQFIKRPLNAYMIWTRQERRKILTGDPKLKMNEVSKAIQMGEKWKKMSDKDKKPYFEMARKFAMEHKQALQEHPELTYAPSKKKGPKNVSGSDQKGEKGSKLEGEHQAHHTPMDPSSRSTTPRQLINPQGVQQNPMFVQFQTQLNSGTMQIAQVLGVRPPVPQTNAYGLPLNSSTTASMSAAPMFMQPNQSGVQSAFLQPQMPPPQRFSTPGMGIQSSAAANRTPGQMLDLYYTSLCQPAFPGIAESPINTLAMQSPQYFLEQYNQHFQQQQQGGGANSSGTAPHF